MKHLLILWIGKRKKSPLIVIFCLTSLLQFLKNLGCFFLFFYFFFFFLLHLHLPSYSEFQQQEEIRGRTKYNINPLQNFCENTKQFDFIDFPANKLRNNYVIFRHFLVTNKRN